MIRLLTGGRISERTSSAATTDALGDAWARAEQYGKPRLERESFGGHRYEARIWCDAPSGSSFFAKGTADTPTEALNIAIDEAERVASIYRGRS